MCGIAGIISQDASTVNEDVIRRMTDSLSHRGPDDSGIWLKEGVALGHRRLSIIDLSEKGHQPMWDITGRYCIVFNGEIYNFSQLRKRLTQKGYSFRSQTDTEVTLNLFAEYGPDCVHHMEGMWSFALYDSKTGHLFCSRDRFGKKPFYYYLTKNHFVFASQPKALRKVSIIPFELDSDGVAYYLTYGYIPEPFTAWKEIKKLPHASNLLFDTRNMRLISLTSYWNTKEWLLPDDQLTDKQIDEGIRSHLHEAVKRRLIADVPVGAFLSGGIDSSAVVAAMTKVSPASQIHTFSIGFDYKRYDETRFAQQVANTLGTHHHVKILTASEALKIAQQLPAYYDEPFADSSMIPTYAVSQLAREHVTVALSGDGADELWGGYLNYVMYSYLQSLKKLIPSPLHSQTNTVASWLAQVIRPARSNPGLALGLKGLSWLSHKDHEIFARLSSLYVEVSQKYYKNFHPHFIHQNWNDNVMQAYLNTHLIDDFLVKVDRASMAHSLEVRSPFLDSDFVRYALHVPANQKVWVQGHKYHLKGALRRSLKEMLPPEVLGRGKQGFSLPMSEYMVREWLSEIKEHVAALPEKGIIPFSQSEIDQVVKDHTKGIADYSQFLYALMFLNMWHEHWKS